MYSIPYLSTAGLYLAYSSTASTYPQPKRRTHLILYNFRTSNNERLKFTLVGYSAPSSRRSSTLVWSTCPSLSMRKSHQREACQVRIFFNESLDNLHVTLTQKVTLLAHKSMIDRPSLVTI